MQNSRIQSSFSGQIAFERYHASPPVAAEGKAKRRQSCGTEGYHAFPSAAPILRNGRIPRLPFRGANPAERKGCRNHATDGHPLPPPLLQLTPLSQFASVTRGLLAQSCAVTLHAKAGDCVGVCVWRRFIIKRVETHCTYTCHSRSESRSPSVTLGS
jgi:hypothetical protein